jgi:predicted Zn-dependent protease
MMQRDEIEAALRGHNADYVEIRLDDTDTSRIVYRGRELEEIGRSRSFGGNARALVNGGWGFVSFNDPSNLRSELWRRWARRGTSVAARASWRVQSRSSTRCPCTL